MMRELRFRPDVRRSGLCALRAIAEGRSEARYASKSEVGSELVERGTPRSCEAERNRVGTGAP